MSSFVQRLFMVSMLFSAKLSYGRDAVALGFSLVPTPTCHRLLGVGCVLFLRNRSTRPPPVCLPLVACHRQARPHNATEPRPVGLKDTKGAAVTKYVKRKIFDPAVSLKQIT
jgi:hypothetical protein